MSISRTERRKSLMGSDPVFSQSHTPAVTQSYDPIDGNHNQPSYEPQPAFDQQSSPTLSQQRDSFPPNYEMNSNHGTFDQGFAHRQGVAPPKPSTKSASSRICGFMSNKWAAMFLAVTAIQAVICLCFEVYIFVKFQSSVLSEDLGEENKDIKKEISANMKTIPTFLTLFIFGFLYELVVVWDALRAKNTIQIIGVCLANLALVVYTAIQVDQILVALKYLAEKNHIKQVYNNDPFRVFDMMKASLIAIPNIIAFITILMAFITWKLYQEFAWDILKVIGADYGMKKRFLHYQVYIALLKFDFFFFLGFILQLVVIVTDTTDPEFGLTIATIPITIAILVAAAFFTRRENKWGMGFIIILYLGGLSYFVFKLARIHSAEPQWKAYYSTVRKSLTAFAVLTILLIILTITNCIVCMLNFNKGLKQHLISPKKKTEESNMNDVNLNDVKPQASRMTID